MDLKTFSENDFDPKRWINKAWNSSGDQEKEVFVSNTVSRLQLYMKQLTNSLDEATSQIITSLPRVLQDATALHEDGSLLWQKLLALDQKVQGVEEQTGHSIESLQRIDKLKSKLENAALTLHEADKWVALTSSLENILENGIPTTEDHLNELSDQVAAMTQSLELMSDASDYDTKQVQLETLFNRLEAAISPPFIEALIQMDANRATKYVSVYRGMWRLNAAARCWRQAAAARLSSSWRGLSYHSIPALTGELTTAANTQVEWLTNVLKIETPLAELIRLYTDLLLSLEPSPTKLVTANLKLCAKPEEGILLITDVKRDLDLLVDRVKMILEAPKNNKEKVNATLLYEFGRAVYAPLREVLPSYSELQAQVLEAHLRQRNFGEQSDLLEFSRGIVAALERCEDWLTSAYARSLKIAGIAAYPYYVASVEKFMGSIIQMITSHGRRIESDFLSSLPNGGGVLAPSFGAALLLTSASADLMKIILERYRVEVAVPLPSDQAPLVDPIKLILGSESRLTEVRAQPPASVSGLRLATEHLTTLARNILKQPVNTQLEKVPHLNVWNNNDALTSELPDFALAPQEYITEVGQYLMTLPQHLELHLSDKQAPWHFLAEVCVYTCDLYASQILNIRNMDDLGTKRCVTDIQYLSSVVEDLGSSITPPLKNLEKSLRGTSRPSDH